MIVTIDGIETEVISNITEVSQKIYNEIHVMIVEDLNSCLSERNLKDCNKFKITIDVVNLVLNDILLKNPNFVFCVNYGINYSDNIYNETGLKIATKILYSYSLSKEKMFEQNHFLDSVLQELNIEMKYLKTDLDKILFLCNYFKKESFTSYEYDGSVFASDIVYSIFYNKTANVVAYSYALGFLFSYFNVDYEYTIYNNNNNIGVSVYLNDEWYFIDIGMELYQNTNCFVLKSLNNKMFGDDSHNYFENVFYPILGTAWELTPDTYSTKYDWLELR